MNELFTNIIGYSAAVIGTSLMMPQVIKSLRSKSVKDLSYLTLVLYFLNCLLWAIYGFMLAALPMIICNVIGFVISVFQLMIKVKYNNK